MTISLDDRLVESVTAALEVYGVHLGRALGLYAPLADRGPLTAVELADAAGIDDRYAREWLEQQAVSAYLVVDDPSRPAEQRRYALPPEHVGVLVDVDDAAHVSPLADMVAGIGHVIARGRRGLPDRSRRALPPGTARTSVAARAVSTGPPSRAT